MKFSHHILDDASQALIEVPGLKHEVKVWHLTDSHMTTCDERDAAAWSDAEKFDAVFRPRTPKGVGTRRLFEDSLTRAKEAGVDALALGGDITHFPSHLGLECIREGAEGLGKPWLYSLGNHDWHFPQLEWNESTREAYYPRFDFVEGGTPEIHCCEVGGITLIALDNSSYQVSDSQVDFLAERLQRGKVCLLFVHIPLYIPELEPAVVEAWKAPIMMGAPDWCQEAREKWKTRSDDQATKRLMELVGSDVAQNLAAVFCGHVHFHHADVLRPDCVQYVGAPGFAGGERLVRLVPA
jgi:hypothetical protein